MFDDCEERRYWEQQRLSDFDNWLGEWLTWWFNEQGDRYQAPYESDPPGPSRYLWRENGSPLAIWICLGPTGDFGAARAVESMRYAMTSYYDEFQGADFILASPNDVAPFAADLATHPKVQILDASFWLGQWEHVGSWHDGVATMLRRRLHAIPSGRNGADRLFEELVADLLFFLFYPNLGRPQLQRATLVGAKRRDCLLPINLARPGIWTELARLRPAFNLVAEAKNLAGPATTKEVDDAHSYLVNDHAPGNLCVLASRVKPNPTAYLRLRELACNGKLILPIYDDVIEQMLDVKSYGARGAMTVDDIIHVTASDIMSG